MATLDSYPVSNGDVDWVGLPADAHDSGQSFRLSTGASITSARLMLAQAFDNLGGTCVAKIYAHTGTFGVDGLPTGSALATSDPVTVNTIRSLSGGWESAVSAWEATPALESDCTLFTFSTPYQTIANTPYFLVLEYLVDNYLLWITDSSSPTHSGNAVRSMDGSTWNLDAGDARIFYLYGDIISNNVGSMLRMFQ